jgi:hypothetical protein
MNNLRYNGYRAKTAVTLIWIVMFLDIISFISGYFQLNLILRVEDGIAVSASEIDSNDTREQGIAIFYLIAYIISGIVFIQWFRRAYFNLHQKKEFLSFSEGWAAGSWFVPIVSLYRPLQIMKELYEETRDFLITKGETFQKDLTTNFLGLWWTLWIVNNLIGQIIFRIDADTLPVLKGVTLLSLAGNAIGIILAFVTVKVIRDYAEAEEVLFRMKEETVIVEDEKLIENGSL